MPSVDFKECYDKVKLAYNITQDLVIAIVDKLGQNNPTTLYSFYHPISGEKLDAETICQDVSITVYENLDSFFDKSNPNYNSMKSLTDQNINIFDLNDPFYTDICYDFESPTNKDIPLKDRVSVFYPNVTLCDEGCTNKGVNIEDMTSICDCSFVDIANSNIVKENVILDSVFGEAMDIINESNILVMKCYKYIFKHFIRSVGGWLCLILLIAQIALTIIFYLYELIRLKRYVLNLTESYLTFISKSQRRSSIHMDLNLAIPPKKNVKFKRDEDKNNKKNKFKKENDINIIRFNTKNKEAKNKSKEKDDKNLIKNSKMALIKEKKQLNSKKLLPDKITTIKNSTKTKESSDIDTKSMDKAFQVDKKDAQFFIEYLATPLDDMYYDDAVVKDKRNFREYFYEVIKERQMIAYIFIAEDPLKARTTKIMLFGLNIVLYFVVNGLFFSEDYISEVYNSTKKEKFFTFFPRSLPRFVYCTIVSIVISYITDLFFIEEKKIAGIYKREKDNKVVLKYKINELVKDIGNRYLAFIIIVYIILLISFYYLLCFNYVYPKTQVEWVKSSIVIFIIMQILSILSCLLEAGLRILSFKCKSEKMYKISRLLS